MAVNVAAQQLAHPGFVQEVLAVLAETGLPPHLLVVEITESVVMSDLAAASPRLAALRELGIRVAIDDFGTGYSSLAYLSPAPRRRAQGRQDLRRPRRERPRTTPRSRRRSSR